MYRWVASYEPIGTSTGVSRRPALIARHLKRHLSTTGHSHSMARFIDVPADGLQHLFWYFHRSARASAAASRAPEWAHGRVKPTGSSSPGAAALVPKAEMRIGNPVAYASTILSWPITRPTWPGASGVPSAPAKKTRSPGSTRLAGTRGPHANCSCEVRGMDTPAAR